MDEAALKDFETFPPSARDDLLDALTAVADGGHPVIAKPLTQHPDEFIHGLLNVDPAAVIDAITRQQQRLRSPPVAMADLLALFERLGLVRTVAEVRRLMT